jgi:hypothetical protein
MKKTAYMTAIFKLVNINGPKVPIFDRVEIYSDAHPTLGSDRLCLVLCQASADDFTLARADVLELAASIPAYGWAVDNYNRQRLMAISGIL